MKLPHLVLAVAASVFALGTYARAADPVVSNIRASQRAGTKLVDILYDVADADSATVTVSIRTSSDGGSTWTVPCTSVTGNGVGSSVVPGSNKAVVWNAGADWNGEWSDQMRVEVVVDDTPRPPADEFALIPGGTASGTDPDFGAYSLTVTSFYMGRTEVTKTAWDTVRTWGLAHGYTDLPAGDVKGQGHPVQSVSWYDCVKWCNARSEKEGRVPCYTSSGGVYRTGHSDDVSCVAAVSGYRLPTDTEWGYAARGGLSGKRFPWGDTIAHSQANYYSSSSYSYDVSPTRGYHPDYDEPLFPHTSPVGSFPANGYELRDMSGNVWEWCWDWSLGHEGSDRVMRGGSWTNRADSCRAGYSNRYAPDSRTIYCGFRLCLADPDGPQPNIELLGNGRFEDGLSDWTNVSHYMSGSPYPGGVTVEQDGTCPYLHLAGTGGANYYLDVDQTVQLVESQPDASFSLSFDWRVTEKETPYGRCSLHVRFFDQNDQRVGEIVYIDTANPGHTLDSIRGSLPTDAFHGERKYREVFDWEHVAVSTRGDLPGMDAGLVRSVTVQAVVQNDAGSGGTLDVASLSLELSSSNNTQVHGRSGLFTVDTRDLGFVVEVQDQTGTVREGALVVRYPHGSGEAIDTLTTDSAGQVGYRGTAQGEQYDFEVYYEGANPFDELGELWAAETATIGTTASPLVMRRDWPYVEQLGIVRVADSWTVPAGAVIAPGHELKRSARVRNGTAEDRDVSVRGVLDRSGAVPWDHDETATGTVPAQGASDIDTTFMLLDSGVYQKAVRTEVVGSGKTDAWDWCQAFEVLDVSQYHNGTVAFAGMDWHKVDSAWEFGLHSSHVIADGEQLVLRVTDGAGVGAQIESESSDYSYGEFLASIKAVDETDTDGVCQGFFYYHDDDNEIDVEILSDDPDNVHFVVQGGESFTVPVPNQSSEFHEYGFRWYPDRVEFLLDGDVVETATVNIPQQPGAVILNNWTGNPGWSGYPPKGTGDLDMRVASVGYTRHDPNPPELDYLRVSQRSGTKLVDIQYRLVDPEGDGAAVTVAGRDLEQSVDVPMATLSGDGAGGEPVAPGGMRWLVWDAGTDWSGHVTDRLQVTLATESGQLLSDDCRVDTREVTGPGSLAIIITSGHSSAPLPGASVSVAGANATSRSNGECALTPLPAGEHTLTVTAEGHVPESRPVTVEAGKTRPVDVRLQQEEPPARYPTVVSVTPQYGETFPVMAGENVTNRYTAHVIWNGSPGTVRFEAPNRTVVVDSARRGAYLEAEFDMRTAFNPSPSLAGNWRRENPLVVTATNGEGMTSPPMTVYPGVFWVPDWVIGLPYAEVALARGGGGWTFAVDARYPASPVVGKTNVPAWVPFIGGEFGLEATQAILAGEFKSASSSGQITLSGRTGFSGGGMGSLSGSVGGGLGFGLGEDWCLDGLFRAGVQGKLRGKMGILQAVPEPTVQAFALTYQGQLINDRVKLFAEVSPEVAVQVAFGLLSAQGGGWDLGFRGTDVEIGVGLTAGVEVDLTEALWVRGYAGGRPKVFMHFPADPEWFKRAEIKFVTGVEVKSFFDVTLLKAEKAWYLVLYDSAERARDAASGLRGAVAEGNAVVLSQTLLAENNVPIRGPQAGGYVFLPPGERTTRSGRGTETVLLADCFSECKPALAVNGGTKLLVYVVDDPAKAALQSTEIQFVRDTGTGWHAPAPLTADTHLDCSPTVAFDEDGNAVAVWHRSRSDSLDDPGAVAPNLEVAYAVLEVGTDAWTTPEFLTDNGYADYGARLARGNDGSLLLVWAANEGNETVGTEENPSRLLARRWNVATLSWGPELVALADTDGAGLAEFDAAWNGTTGDVVCVRDGDGDFETADDTELLRVHFDGTAFGTPEALTDDTAEPVADRSPELVTDSAGTMHLAWLRGERMLLAGNFDLANAELVRERGTSTGLTGCTLARGAGDNLFLVWPDDPGGQADLRYRVYDVAHGVWGGDGCLTDDTGMEKAASAAVAADGSLLLAYAKTAISMESIEVELEATRETVTIPDVPREGATDLVWLEHEIGIDLRIGAVEVSPPNPAPGTEAQVDVRVANDGDGVCAAVTVALYDGDPDDGGVLVGAAKALAAPLAGQSLDTLTWSWTVPAADLPHCLWAVVDPDDAIEEFVEDNNNAAQPAVLADLAATEASASWVSDDAYRLSLRVANVGAVASGPFTVRFQSADAARSELGTVVVPAVAAGWEDVVSVDWDATGIELPLQITCVLEPEDDWVDFSAENHSASMLLQSPSVRTPAVPAGLQAEPGLNDIRLRWTDTADDEDGFRIVRIGGTRGDEEIGFVGVGVTEFVDETVVRDVDYTYAVFAYNSAGVGERSASVEARTLPDTDDDDLPDEWEMAQFGSLDQTAADDYDGDGEDNGTEYANGTDPTDAMSTDDPANAYTDFYFAIWRAALQTPDAGRGFFVGAWGAKLVCNLPDGWEFASGTLAKPEESAGTTPVALVLDPLVAGRARSDTVHGDLDALMADFAPGVYRVHLILDSTARETADLRFAITVPAYGADDFPPFVAVQDPAPNATGVSVTPVLQFDTDAWDLLLLTEMDTDTQIYLHVQDEGEGDTHAVPADAGLAPATTYALDVDRNEWGDTWLGSVTRLRFTTDRAAQTISFDPLPAVSEGAPSFDLVATATSGLPVSFSSSDETVVTVAEADGVWTATIVGLGEATITASQSGDANWNPALEVPRVLVVHPVLTVIHGSGSGSYAPQSTVAIGETVGAGRTFTGWTCDPVGFTGNLVNPSAGSTDFLMPNANVTLTATYTFDEPDWSVALAGVGAESGALTFGMHLAATDGWDEGLDVAGPDLPLRPGQVALVSEDLAVSYSVERRAVAETAKFLLVASAGDVPTVVSWDAPAIPDGKFLTIYEVVLDERRDAVARAPVGNTALDMGASLSLEVPAGETRWYVIRYADDLVYDLAFGVGWNLISLPIEPPDPAVAAVLDDGSRAPVHEGSVQGWDGTSYVVVDEMQACVGYWVYVTTAAVLLVPGTPVVQGELELRQGWSLCRPTRLRALPASGRAYTGPWIWNPETLRYRATNYLLPGWGHWIHSSEAVSIPLADPE